MTEPCGGDASGSCSHACQDPDAEQGVRAEVVRFCRRLHERGYLAANDGNVSVRLCRRRVLITPSGVPKALLGPEDLCVVGPDGQVLSGSGRPSGELLLHLSALAVRPDAAAVIHAHPPSCIALSLFRHLRVEDVLPEVILHLGRIQVVPYQPPCTEALAEAAASALAELDGVILERHGTAAVGRTLADAYAATERLEHAAHVLCLAHAVGRPAPLPEAEARRLRGIHERTRDQTH